MVTSRTSELMVCGWCEGATCSKVGPFASHMRCPGTSCACADLDHRPDARVRAIQAKSCGRPVAHIEYLDHLTDDEVASIKEKHRDGHGAKFALHLHEVRVAAVAEAEAMSKAQLFAAFKKAGRPMERHFTKPNLAHLFVQWRIADARREREAAQIVARENARYATATNNGGVTRKGNTMSKQDTAPVTKIANPFHEGTLEAGKPIYITHSFKRNTKAYGMVEVERHATGTFVHAVKSGPGMSAVVKVNGKTFGLPLHFVAAGAPPKDDDVSKGRKPSGDKARKPGEDKGAPAKKVTPRKSSATPTKRGTNLKSTKPAAKKAPAKKATPTKQTPGAKKRAAEAAKKATPSKAVAASKSRGRTVRKAVK